MDQSTFLEILSHHFFFLQLHWRLLAVKKSPCHPMHAQPLSDHTELSSDDGTSFSQIAAINGTTLRTWILCARVRRNSFIAITGTAFHRVQIRVLRWNKITAQRLQNFDESASEGTCGRCRSCKITGKNTVGRASGFKETYDLNHSPRVQAAPSISKTPPIV